MGENSTNPSTKSVNDEAHPLPSSVSSAHRPLTSLPSADLVLTKVYTGPTKSPREFKS